jgi:tetratricopeptide (TPR) repeat protein
MTIDQAVELLELAPPCDLRAIQLARRELAKRWHPDRAKPDQRIVHEKQMKAVNSAADLLTQRVEADGPITALDIRVSADAHRRRQAEAGRRAYEERQQAGPDVDAGSFMPDRSIVYRYVRSATYPEWGVGSVVGVSFTGEGDDIQPWARVEFDGATTTLPVDNLTFVDFAQRERDAERAQRFLTAARDAISQRNHELATRRLVYARNADPRNPEILALLAGQYHQRGMLKEAGRAARDWIRSDPDDPAAHRLARDVYADMGAHDLAADAERAASEAQRRRTPHLRRRRPDSPPRGKRRPRKPRRQGA